MLNAKHLALNVANRIYCFFLYHGDELSQAIIWLRTIYDFLRLLFPNWSNPTELY